MEDSAMELVADHFPSVISTVHDIMFSSNEYRLARAPLTQIQLQEIAFLQLTHDTLVHELETTHEVVSRPLKQS